jgi:hypothetical protein
LLSVSTKFRQQYFVTRDGQWTGSVPVHHVKKR